MDNFIDKLAQKFTAGEVIQANSAAEERELRKLREQVAEYEKCLQEMRKVQMTNTQTALQLQELMEESTEAFRRFTQESEEAIRKFAEENTQTVQTVTEDSLTKVARIQLETDVQKAEAKKSVEVAAAAMEKMEEKVIRMQETVAQLTETMAKDQKEIAQWFQQADDFLHKENVKVYRNVQAVVVNEVASKTETVMKAQEELAEKIKKPILIITGIGAAAAIISLGMQILQLIAAYRML